VSEFVVDFLPSEFRRRGVMAASRRRSVLLLGLLGAMVVGVAAHSWNRFREAESRRSVSLALTTNAAKVDDVVDRLAEQQRELHRYLSVYERLALPVEQSDLLATITHLMPERTSLSMLRLEVKDDAAAKAADAAKDKASKPGDAAKPAAAPARWMEVTIRGYAAGNADLYDLERKLANTKPFDAVTVSENKPIDVPGSHVQEFKVTCRVPLDVKYVRPGSAVVAGAKEASR
jgi:Tfp pilus assembly protein PilN